MSPPQTIRTRLKQVMDQHGLTAVELARRSGVKSSFLYDILNGKSANPSSVTLGHVATALGVSLAWLSGGGQAASTESEALVAIPYLAVEKKQGKLSLRARAGKTPPCYFLKHWLEEYVRCSPSSLNLFTLTGDDMAPTLNAGDTVLVNTEHIAPSPAGIYLLWNGMELAVRRLECATAPRTPIVRVSADNPRYGSYERPLNALEIVGRVVWLSRVL